MADRLPEEVLIDILTRLTIEDLVRCIIVCKSWYSLITSPNFISFHIKRIASSSPLLLVREHDYDGPDKKQLENYSLHLDNDTFGVYKHLDFPLKCSSYNRNFRVIGCVDGVICLSDDLIGYMDVIILWNPTIKKSLTLPEPLVTYESHGPYGHDIGFGFSKLTNDYKVVRAVHLRDGNRDDSVPPIVEVYDLSVGYWRIIDSMYFKYCGVNEQSSQIFLNGNIHWVGYKGDSNNQFCTAIVTFDLDNEVLGVMKLPDSVADWSLPNCPNPQSIVFSLLGGSLSLSHQNSLSWDTHQSCVWVMKQYGVPESWTKLFTIDYSEGLKRVFGLRNNGEALLSVKNYKGTAMVSYDPKRNKLKYLEELPSDHRSFNAVNFVESLSLLGAKGGSTMKAGGNTVAQKGSPEEVDADKKEQEDPTQEVKQLNQRR